MGMLCAFALGIFISICILVVASTGVTYGGNLLGERLFGMKTFLFRELFLIGVAQVFFSFAISVAIFLGVCALFAPAFGAYEKARREVTDG